MYATAFILGFFTSFGWWSAAKIQKTIDGEPARPAIIVEQEKK